MTNDAGEARQRDDAVSFNSTRARLLVTMLGADFAKRSKHPFFDRLVDLAMQDAQTQPSQQDDPGLSHALSQLVERLDRPEMISSVEKSEASHEVSEPSAPEKPTERNGVNPIDSLRDQHPAVIANTVANLTSKERSAVLKTLPGRTARQVLAILRAL